MFFFFSVVLISWVCFPGSLRTLSLPISSVSTSLSHPQEVCLSQRCCYVAGTRSPADEYSLHGSYTGELSSVNYTVPLEKLPYPNILIYMYSRCRITWNMFEESLLCIYTDSDIFLYNMNLVLLQKT